MPLQIFHNPCVPQSQHMVRSVNFMYPLSVHLPHVLEPYAYPSVPHTIIMPHLQVVVLTPANPLSSLRVPNASEHP